MPLHNHVSYCSNHVDLSSLSSIHMDINIQAVLSQQSTFITILHTSSPAHCSVQIKLCKYQPDISCITSHAMTHYSNNDLSRTHRTQFYVLCQTSFSFHHSGSIFIDIITSCTLYLVNKHHTR